MVLDKLMEYVALEEEKLDEEALHSFYPLNLPLNVSQLPLTDKEQRHTRDSTASEDPIRSIPRTRRYLPCHYFDQIGGSSTGA